MTSFKLQHVMCAVCCADQQLLAAPCALRPPDSNMKCVFRRGIHNNHHGMMLESQLLGPTCYSPCNSLDLHDVDAALMP